MTRLQKIIALFIGAVFMLSAVGKALNVYLFQMLIHSYGLPYLDWLAPIIVLLELVLAFLFFVQYRVKYISLGSIVLLILFTAVYTFGYTRQGVTDCGCFGIIRLPDIPPFYVYLRNIILLALLNYLYFTTDEHTTPWTKRRSMVFSACLVITMFWTGVTFRPRAFTPKLEHPLTGKPVADTPLARFVPQSASVLLLCYSYQCAHCMNTMENFFAVQRYNRVDTIVAVALISENETDTLQPRVLTLYPQLGNNTILATSLPQISNLPTSLLIEDDTIRQVFVGELVNPYFIETNKTKTQNYENN